MKKSTLIPLLVALVAVIVMIVFISANGTLRNEKKTVEAEAADLQTRLSALQTSSDAGAAELETLKADAAKAAEDA